MEDYNSKQLAKQEHKVSYRCSLPSPLQGRSKDQWIALHQAQEGPLLASWVLTPIQPLKSFEILGSILQWLGNEHL